MNKIKGSCAILLAMVTVVSGLLTITIATKIVSHYPDRPDIEILFRHYLCIGRYLLTGGIILFLFYFCYGIITSYGKRSYQFDTGTHTVRDVESNKIMFEYYYEGKGQGGIKDYKTGEILCTFNPNEKHYRDKDNNIVTFDSLAKDWVEREERTKNQNKRET